MSRTLPEPLPLRFELYQPKAEHPSWESLHQEAVERARNIAPLIHWDQDDTALDKLADAARTPASLATALNNYRITRQRFAAGNHALRPMYFIWTLLYHCNFRCSYCDDHRGNHYYDLADAPLDFAGRRRALRLMRSGTSAVYFCGGEPTLVKELPEFTDMAFQLGYHPLMINSNGFVLHEALQRPSWWKWLRQMDIIIISLDGLSLPRLRELWGIKKVEQVFVNLLLLRELRRVVDFKLVVNTVIGPETIEMAGDVLDLVNDLGDVWFVPVPVNYHGKDKEGFAFERDMIRRPDYRALADRILVRKKQGRLIIGSSHLLDMLLNVKPYLCLPALRPHLDPDGHICWPFRAPKNVDHVKINLLDYPSLDAAWDAANQIIPARNFHGPGPDQCGDTCAWMQNYTTGRYHEFLQDPLRAGIFSEIKEFAFQSR
jgi:MoaA/NifB/PqqE/SkfB family radical SAM enzyme